MTPFRLFQQTLKSVPIRHFASATKLSVGDKLLGGFQPAGLNLNHFRAVVNGRVVKHDSNPQNEDKRTINTRESIREKIEKSQEKFRIVSLPNIITTSRLLMAPAMGYFIMNNMHYQALICCTYAAISDVADKAIAKLTKQSSPLNFFLDAIADKAFITTSCLALYNLNIVNIYFIKSIIVRDFIILAGGATIRYHSFEEPPSLRKYLDLNSYPSLAFRTTTLNQVNAGLHYALIMALLSLNHLDGDPVYDWSMFSYLGLLMLLSSTSIALCLSSFFQPRFLSFIRKL